MRNFNLVALYVGMVFSGGFLTYAFVKYRKVPEFLEIAVIILSCIGAVIGVNIGYIVLTCPDIDLGRLSEYRVQIMLGSLAIIWTSIDSLYKTSKQSIDAIKAKKRIHPSHSDIAQKKDVNKAKLPK